MAPDPGQLRAEALAIPLASVEALRSGDPRVDFSVLLPALRARLGRHGSDHAAEDVAGWTWRRNETVPDLLQRHGRRLLQPAGPRMRLVPDRKMPGREILDWRWISLALPASLLIAAAAPRGSRPPPAVQILDPTLIPRGPVAHLHVHKGASYPFELLWSHLAAVLDLKDVKNGPEGIDGTEWRALLVRAFLARRVLDAHARHGGPLGHCEAGCRADPLVRRALAQFVRGRSPAPPRYSRDEDRLRERARASARRRRPPLRRRPDTVADAWSRDPVGDGLPCPEVRFLRRSLDHLEDHPHDALYLRLWVQYVRVKTLLHRLLVVDPTARGLASFCGQFSRTGNYHRGALERLFPELAGREDGLDLRAAELRTGLPDGLTKMREQVDGLRRLRDGVERAWVYHFIRHQGGDDRPSDPPPLHRRAGARFLTEAGRLERWLGRYPRWLRHVRGLDVASEELKGPLWLLVPWLKRLRAASRRIALACGGGVEPLRLTLHVGEDFRHLATGLRAIHEPYEWGLMDRGDRLGHALALGVDVSKWCERNRRVLQPRVERVLDLAWMWSAIGTFRIPVDGTSLRCIEWELEEQAARLWGGAPRARHVVDLRQLLGRGDALRRIGHPGRLRPPLPSDPVWAMLHALIWSTPVCDRSRDLVEVETEGEAGLLEALQQALGRHLALWQVAIEVNPSSNLLVAGLDHPLDQPMFRLRPLEPDHHHVQNVVIGADDPITFATTLADEYAYAWAGAVVGGDLPPSYVRAWLEEAAETSWRMRFTASCTKPNGQPALKVPPGERRVLDERPQPPGGSARLA